MSGEFNVVWWDPDGRHYYEKRFCGAEEAIRTAVSLTRRPAAMIGIIKRVIITDGGDCINWEWKDGKVVYPEEGK
jgi:hypothetical protein